MGGIYWKSSDGGEKTTNISYNCVDRHMASLEDKYDTAFAWEGNYWDDNVHDYADLNWDTVDVLVQKIANIFKEYCAVGEKVFLLLHHTIQLPISLLAASRIGAVAVVMNPASTSATAIAEVLKETEPKLVVTVDGFWQRHELLATKQTLDEALVIAQVSSVKNVLVIRHTAPNPGIPPPEVIIPGRRPCYEFEVKMNEPMDILWTELVRKAETSCDITWVHSEHPFAILPEWTPKLQIHTISTGHLLNALEQYSQNITSFCLSLAHPQSTLGLVGILAPWFDAKVLVTFEGVLDHPDPARLKQVIAKYEVKSAILPRCDLDPEYMKIVPVPTLSRIISEAGYAAVFTRDFPGVEIIELDVERLLD
ncbi:unnamed protein product [Cylicocyclus nassatus]|uniref:acetate--CoA ligase n=1 Tax=Cylicocyclus nassatus TaxID=53992 RepID=A0AA36GYE7_CYLNA|nr:unnamed protein product [Cylicocyclus nassatus]